MNRLIESDINEYIFYLTFQDIITLSRINKLHYKKMIKHLSWFLSQLPTITLNPNMYFINYHKGKSYYIHSLVDESFSTSDIIYHNEHTVFTRDNCLLFNSVKSSANWVHDDYKWKINNCNYTEHDMEIIITKSGQCYIFYSVLGQNDTDPTISIFDDKDIFRMLLVAKFEMTNLSALLNLFYRDGLINLVTKFRQLQIV